MIDIDLLVSQLRERGHVVDTVIKVPDNAGEYEFGIDGVMLPLEEARLLLERDQTAEEAKAEGQAITLPEDPRTHAHTLDPL